MKRIFLLGLLVMSFVACDNKQKSNNEEEQEVAIVEPKEITPLMEFGFNLNDYVVVKDTIRQGDSFGELLAKNHIGYPRVYEIANKSRDSFDIRRLQIGKPYTILCSKDSLQQAQCFIYQPNSIDYVVLSFQDSILTYRDKKPVTSIEKRVSGVINENSSLSQTLLEAGVGYDVAEQMARIYDYTIDFFALQKGDKFKLVYDEKFIDDTIYAGASRIKGALFEHKGVEFYAFDFETNPKNGLRGYYDENAKEMKRFFLKAPLDIFRITSRYSPRRFHPVQKRWKAHKGTDYAAPKGTPIRVTASGTVIKSSYTAGNGNYVKVKHNNTYTTQYLHMSKRIAKVGQYVKQGDIIGLVGSTGLATGPHVCYRFWKNGRQVDPLREVMPPADPLDEKLKEKFFAKMKPLKTRLDKIPYDDFIDGEDELVTENTSNGIKNN
ncbi:Murein DD-endopeptidase MepM and murein hydrolase activator NlpD, contain LysM domain [Pustulibacterium marinum]|uniref:Murein DD-endopeptidase MepM and murein hydrolase activator NlpD, contain LysM domain n=1 Tax=Pustulibacterium marinum TaxID=1224947 RepID=A0A1I7HCY8_9FLAO|nr:peptidoglycan DD-metalloendopeptidase family protein [Pustulibacterium marinum]SFU58326.1 Murein DD-endopeptidase MepM and murein hydrolase activator NlpD, contain LysM domain [Pustulibacterium marinum]